MVRNCLKTLDSGFRRNDGKWYFLTFYEIIKVKLIKQGFDSETNAEFIRFLRYARQFYTKVQSEPYVTLDVPNREL
jgi:hypothetical protein